MVDKTSKADIKNQLIHLYNSGEFGKVISTVDNEIDEIGESEIDTLIKKIYAFSLIRTGNIPEAQRILEDILENYPEDFETLNAMGYIQIFKGNKTAALNYLLDAEYYAQGDAKEKIKKNLSLFSEIPDISTLRSIVKPKEFLVLNLPKTTKSNLRSRTKQLLNFVNFILKHKLATATLIVVLGAAFVYLLFSPMLIQPNQSNNTDTISRNISRIEIDTATKLIEPKPILTNNIILSDKEIISLFNELRVLLSKNRNSNRARFIANYLLNSNASTQVKHKVEVLKTFMEEPEVNLDWQPIYEEVNSKPILYDGVYVMWRGKVVNVVKGENSTEFTFVIYGKSESVIRGFIKARMRNFLEGFVGQTITVLGKISTSKDITLEVVKVIE
ncbi:MAG: hypothetical protein ABDH28_02105 [Brevinematia bacterium]